MGEKRTRWLCVAAGFAGGFGAPDGWKVFTFVALNITIFCADAIVAAIKEAKQTP